MLVMRGKLTDPSNNVIAESIFYVETPQPDRDEGWFGSCTLSAANLIDLKKHPRLRLELRDGRRGKIVLERLSHAGLYLQFTGASPLSATEN